MTTTLPTNHVFVVLVPRCWCHSKLRGPSTANLSAEKSDVADRVPVSGADTHGCDQYFDAAALHRESDTAGRPPGAHRPRVPQLRQRRLLHADLGPHRRTTSHVFTSYGIYKNGTLRPATSAHEVITRHRSPVDTTYSHDSEGPRTAPSPPPESAPLSVTTFATTVYPSRRPAHPSDCRDSNIHQPPRPAVKHGNPRPTQRAVNACTNLAKTGVLAGLSPLPSTIPRQFSRTGLAPVTT